MTEKGSVWKCEACGSLLKGVDFNEFVKGKFAHASPTGGECRATNISKQFGADESKAVEPYPAKSS